MSRLLISALLISGCKSVTVEVLSIDVELSGSCVGMMCDDSWFDEAPLRSPGAEFAGSDLLRSQRCAAPLNVVRYRVSRANRDGGREALEVWSNFPRHDALWIRSQLSERLSARETGPIPGGFSTMDDMYAVLPDAGLFRFDPSPLSDDEVFALDPMRDSMRSGFTLVETHHFRRDAGTVEVPLVDCERY